MAVRSKYQPFSLQERIAPLLMLKEEYDKINEGLAALGETANQYYQYLDENTRQIVDSYNAQLEDVAGSLSSEGMKSVSRNTLNNLRRAYSSKIKPIQEAAQTVGTIQAQIRELQMKDPTLMVQSVPTVSEIMANPNARPSVLSGASLYKNGVNGASQIPTLTYKQIMAGNIPNLDSLVEDIANANGVDPNNAQAREWIRRGLSDGIGARTAEMSDYAEKVRLQEQSDIRKQAASYNRSVNLENLKQKNRLEVISAKAAASGKNGKTTGSSRGSGASYNRQMDGTVYVRGNNEYAYNGSFGNAQKDEGEKAELKSKAKGTSVYTLSRENKIRALRYIGVDVSDNASEDQLEILMDENESSLLDYTYKEYIDPKGRVDNNEFKMSPKKVKRDVGDSDSDSMSSYYDDDKDVTAD